MPPASLPRCAGLTKDGTRCEFDAPACPYRPDGKKPHTHWLPPSAPPTPPALPVTDPALPYAVESLLTEVVDIVSDLDELRSAAWDHECREELETEVRIISPLPILDELSDHLDAAREEGTWFDYLLSPPSFPAEPDYVRVLVRSYCAAFCCEASQSYDYYAPPASHPDLPLGMYSLHRSNGLTPEEALLCAASGARSLTFVPAEGSPSSPTARHLAALACAAPAAPELILTPSLAAELWEEHTALGVSRLTIQSERYVGADAILDFRDRYEPLFLPPLPLSPAETETYAQLRKDGTDRTTAAALAQLV